MSQTHLLKSAITTHILDVMRGRPAAGVKVTLEVHTSGHEYALVHTSQTNDDGRVPFLVAHENLREGLYRISFETGAYFTSLGIEGFYPSVSINFHVRDAKQHYHVPLLLSPFGYSTYRGS